MVATSLRHPREPEEGDRERMMSGLGRLWIGGAAIDWAQLNGERRPRRVPLPTYPFERRRYWLERRELESAWGDVRRGIWMALTRAGLSCR